MSAKFSKIESVELGLGEQSDSEVDLVSGDELQQVTLIVEDGKAKKKKGRSCRKILWVNSWKTVIVAVLVFSVALGISFLVAKLATEPSPSEETSSTLSGGAVATDVPWCSEMAGGILERNGSAVDAAITALLCVGAVHAESSGIGGGGFMVVYDNDQSDIHAINFRETAPQAATVNMFHSNNTLSKLGGLAVAVPGELKGMEMAHRMFGRLPWYELFEPVIAMCREGFNITKHTATAIQSNSQYLNTSEIFRRMYFTSDGELKREGDIIRRPEFADTLELIARNGTQVFYNGSIAESIVEEVRAGGGIMTLEDLANYEARLEDPIHIDYSGYSIYSPPVPSGGPELLFALNIMDGYHPSPSDAAEGLTYHRLVEAFKFAFALRSFLGDPNCEGCDAEEVLGTQANMTSESYANQVWRQISDTQTFPVPYYHPHYDPPPSDHGTTHLSVFAPDGQAVSVTSTINGYFGSRQITQTGIVLNNEMDDFSSPNITNTFGVRPSESNYIHPGRQPLSSTCPTIVLKEEGGVTRPVLMVGAAGGTRIPTATAQVVLRVLSFEETVAEAIEARRLHHQLSPNEVKVEENFPVDITQFLRAVNHTVVTSASHAVVQGISVDEKGNVTAHSDSRKQGQAYVVDV